jgi:hypothetical protein
MTRFVFLFALLALPASLTACGGHSSQSELDLIRTEAVSTFLSSQTGTWTPPPPSTPSPTPLPSFTPNLGTPTIDTTPTIDPCFDLMWIEDRSIPDGTRLEENTSFKKTWLVQNTGGCAWPPGFRFVHVGGHPMSGKPLVLEDPIPVGAKRELSVELVVPEGAAGLIQSTWRMSDSSGVYFGDTLSVNIIAGSAETPSETSSP